MKKIFLIFFLIFSTTSFSWLHLEDGNRVFMAHIFKHSGDTKGIATVDKMNFGDVSYSFTVNLGRSYSFYIDENGDTKGAMMIDDGKVEIKKFFIVGDYGFSFFLDKQTIKEMKKGKNVFFYIKTETEDITIIIPLNNFSNSFSYLK